MSLDILDEIGSSIDGLRDRYTTPQIISALEQFLEMEKEDYNHRSMPDVGMMQD